jgi:hypothetical protein
MSNTMWKAQLQQVCLIFEVFRKKSRTQQPIKTGNNIKHNLHKSLRFVFVIAQLFGYFPVLGVLSSSPSSVGFSWFSLRALSSIVTYTSGILIILGHIRLLIVEGYDQFEMSKCADNLLRAPKTFLFLL